MIHNIQHLRGAAAVAVVFFHAIGFSNSYGFTDGMLQIMSGFGAFGVDIFFVISGFIMMHIQSRNPKTTVQFIKSRIVRIVPLYWLLSVSIYVAYLIAPKFFRDMSPDTEYMLYSLFFVSQIIEQRTPIILVGWTLEWEMLFYLVFAIALIFKNKHIAYIGVFLTLFGIAVIFDMFLILEFILGMFLGWIYDNKVIKTHLGSLFIFLGLTLLVVWFVYKDNLVEIDRFFVWGIPSFFLVLGALYSNQLKSKFLNLLGDASYSIYLIQIFTLPIFFKITSYTIPYASTDLVILFSIVFTVLVGVACYLFLEKPMTNRLRSKHL